MAEREGALRDFFSIPIITYLLVLACLVGRRVLSVLLCWWVGIYFGGGESVSRLISSHLYQYLTDRLNKYIYHFLSISYIPTKAFPNPISHLKSLH